MNVYLLDRRSLNWFGQPDFFPRWLSIAFTAILPCIVLWAGIVRRRRIFIVLGFGFVLFSITTVRAYVQVAPLWVVLTGGGILMLVSAAVLRRYLESGADGERAGFTEASLGGQPGKHRAVEILASMSTLTPSASTEPEKPDFHGGGGDFGGAGSSGKF